MMLFALTACNAGKSGASAADSTATAEAAETPAMEFSQDSAFAYVKRQVDFGPRVPNTEAHRLAGEWLSSELRRHGAKVTDQFADLRAFDGTVLKARNIFGQFNPEAESRLLLLAHWDTRPWADEDPDPANHTKANDGANDGASGVGLLLELARQFNLKNPGKGIDILFVDAEDWGATEVEDSWALGAEYFVKNPPVEDYRPASAILVDMVGGKGAVFPREYFSQNAAPNINDAIWASAAAAGYGDYFPNRIGSAVTDDHIKLINGGIPAIDIIEFHEDNGFNPTWHTMADNLDNIDPATLKAVGQTVLNYIYKY